MHSCCGPNDHAVYAIYAHGESFKLHVHCKGIIMTKSFSALLGSHMHAYILWIMQAFFTCTLFHVTTFSPLTNLGNLIMKLYRVQAFLAFVVTVSTFVNY